MQVLHQLHQEKTMFQIITFDILVTIQIGKIVTNPALFMRIATSEVVKEDGL
jgi:hypothetical protein